MAEEIKVKIGSVTPFPEKRQFEITGRDLVTGLPKKIHISDFEIRQAIQEPISTVLHALRRTLERTPPEIASDIVHSGVHVCGGGSLLHGLDEYLRDETGIRGASCRGSTNLCCSGCWFGFR